MLTGLKKVIGVLLILLGLFALLTPFTPGSWLIFVGLELVGIRFVLNDKWQRWIKPRREGPPPGDERKSDSSEQTER